MTPAVRSYTEEKLQKLEKYSRKIIEARVMFSLERYRNIAEIVLRLNGGDITGRAEGTDMYSSVDTVVDKLERMLKKRKGKVTSRRQRGAAKEPAVDLEALQRMPTLEPERVEAQELSVEEAMKELEKSGRELIIFTNRATAKTSVLHRRSNGSFALMEPGS
ncbi:MAG: ribosome-associated translation inhibitor RaiA [Candidatus Eisenbacteria bacterium]